MVKVIVLFPKQEVARSIRNLLVRSGFEVMGVCVTGAQVMQQMEDMEDGLVICSYKYADMVYSELREYLPEGIQMIMLASHTLLRDVHMEGVHTLPMPLKANDLLTKVHTVVDDIAMGQRRKRQRPKQRTREELELLENTKQLLMDNNRISEEEAHEYIQKRSMNSGVGLIEMAKMIYESLTYSI